MAETSDLFSDKMYNKEELDAKVPQLREKFAEQFAENINNGLYDDRDLDRLRTEDTLVRCYLKHQKLNVNNAAVMIDTSFKWRKEMGLHDLSDKSFPREVHEEGAVFFHGQDVNGFRIMLFRAVKVRKDAGVGKTMQRFVAWWLDKHHLKHPDERVVICMDLTDAGMANVDIDLIRFMISCFTTYYPALVGYILSFDMPWIFNAVWKIVKQLMSAEQQKRVLFSTKKDVTKYIPRDQLLVHMGGTDDFEYVYMPSEDSGIGLTNGDLEGSIDMEPSTNVDQENSPKRKKKVTFAEQNHTLYTSVDGDNISDDSTGSSSQRGKAGGRRGSREGGVFQGTLAIISPAEELQFENTENGRDITDSLTITNNTVTQLAYKVKTTSPESYRVRPSSGLIKTGASAEVSVHLHPGHQQTVSRDKFLVMVMEVADTVTSVTQVADLWRNVRKEKYLEHRLRCALLAGKSQEEEEGADPGSLQKQVSRLSEQMESLVSSQKRLESRLHQVYYFQILLAIIGVMVAVAILISNPKDVEPMKPGTANACTPYYSH